MPEARSAVLQDLVVGDEHVKMELEGRRILIKADPRSEAYEAFRTLHENIAASVSARAQQAPENSGLFSRIGAFFRNLFGAANDAGEQASSSAQHRSALHGPQPSSGSDARTRPGHTREIFLDSRGMQVRWADDISTGPVGTSSVQFAESVDLQFAPDSPVTEQLRRCFHELTKLGYAITGVEVANRDAVAVDPKLPEQAAPSVVSGKTSAVTGTPAFQLNSAVAGKATVASSGLAASGETRSNAIVGSADGDDLRPTATTKPKERTPESKDMVTMRLKPGLPDSPARCLVASVENPEVAEVLVAPELLLRALHASAALPSTSERQVTFLQCVKNENGLRIVNVGLGSDGENRPKEWRDATTWWETHGKILAATAEVPNQRVPVGNSAETSARTYVCGPSPLGVSAPIGSEDAEAEPESPTA